MRKVGADPKRRGSAVLLPRELQQVNLNAAGVDIGAESHYVTVPAGRDADGQDVRAFGAFTADLAAVADWLTRCGVETVAMESTGVFHVRSSLPRPSVRITWPAPAAAIQVTPYRTHYARYHELAWQLPLEAGRRTTDQAALVGEPNMALSRLAGAPKV